VGLAGCWKSEREKEMRSLADDADLFTGNKNKNQT
jgi:hypothetical protein